MAARWAAIICNIFVGTDVSPAAYVPDARLARLIEMPETTRGVHIGSLSTKEEGITPGTKPKPHPPRDGAFLKAHFHAHLGFLAS